MKTLKVLRQRPALFFCLSGIRVADFDDLVKATYPLWQTRERKRLSRKGRQRAIGAGMKYRLDFASQLLMCLIYYRTYTSHVFLGLVFGVSSPTVCRRNRDMNCLLAGYFHLPERKVKLSEADKDNLLYPCGDKALIQTCLSAANYGAGLYSSDIIFRPVQLDFMAFGFDRRRAYCQRSSP